MRSTWGLALLLTGFWLAACASEPRQPRPIPFPANKKGVHLLLDDGRQAWPSALWGEHMAAAAEVVEGEGYVLQLIRADDLDVVRWQHFLDLCAAHELRPILRLATTFYRQGGYWVRPEAGPAGDYTGIAADYARFVAALAWPDESHFIIIGNEPNHGEEWGGRVDPAGYARFFLATARALHAADPDAIVLNAPLDQFAPHTNGLPLANGFSYLDATSFLAEMVAAEPTWLSELDGWASHSYPLGPFSRPPEEMVFGIDLLNGAVGQGPREVPAGLFNRGIAGYEWELYQLSTYGVRGLPVFITETGWRHQESEIERALDDGPAGLPDSATVARYLETAFREQWLLDNRVYAVIPFAFNGAPAEWGHSNWLRLSESGEILGAYEMGTAWSGLPPE